VAATVLAAGLSRRWGADNKLLALVDGAPMIRRTVQAVLGSAVRPVIVVTGHEADAIIRALDGLAVGFAHATNYAEGMSASLKAAISAVPLDCAGALICLGDMPYVRPETLDRLAAAFDPSFGHAALIPTYQACPATRAPGLCSSPLANMWPNFPSTIPASCATSIAPKRWTPDRCSD
jgi:molybdenum cofactor cytidylyltransferase